MRRVKITFIVNELMHLSGAVSSWRRCGHTEVEAWRRSRREEIREPCARHQERPSLSPIASQTAAVIRRPFYQHLYFQVLVAIVLGGAIGHFWPNLGESLKSLGDAFI